MHPPPLQGQGPPSLLSTTSKRRDQLYPNTTIWDVDTVLDYLDTIDTNTATPAVLTKKTAMLLSLITVPRGKELFITRSDLIGLTENLLQPTG